MILMMMILWWYYWYPRHDKYTSWMRLELPTDDIIHDMLSTYHGTVHGTNRLCSNMNLTRTASDYTWRTKTRPLIDKLYLEKIVLNLTSNKNKRRLWLIMLQCMTLPVDLCAFCAPTSWQKIVEWKRAKNVQKWTSRDIFARPNVLGFSPPIG